LSWTRLIRQWSDDVLFFPHTYEVTDAERDQLEARGIAIVEGDVQELAVVDDRLAGVMLSDGRTIERTALFVRPDIRPRLLKGIGCGTDGVGFVRVDIAGRTRVPSVWKRFRLRGGGRARRWR
jgi:hypothetical protein